MKIKIIGIDYTYDYASDFEVKKYTEESPWVDYDEEWITRLKNAISHKHLLPAKNPFHNKNYIVLEDFTEEPLNLENFILSVEESAKKELQAKALREERAAQAKLKTAEKSLELKRKKLEQLKKELGE